MDGQITVYDVQAPPEKRGSTNLSASIDPLPLHGTFQSPNDGDSSFDLSWCYDNDKLAVAYSIGDGAIISM